MEKIVEERVDLINLELMWLNNAIYDLVVENERYLWFYN